MAQETVKGSARLPCGGRGLPLSFTLLPFFTQGPFPRFLLSQAPQVLFVVLAPAWGCQAQAWHTGGQLHSSAGLRAASESVSLPQLLAGDWPAGPVLCPQKPSFPELVAIIPFPLLQGTRRKGKDVAILPLFRHGLLPCPRLASWVPVDSGICWLRFLCTHTHIHTHIYVYIYI